MECDDQEEARDLLRHKNSNVTAEIYRNHFGDKQREKLRAKLEARHGGENVETILETDVETSGRSSMQHDADRGAETPVLALV